MAILILVIPLLAIMASFPVALQGTEAGRQQSTAVFLAEQKMEQIRGWAVSTAAGQGFGTITNGSPSTAACCAAEAYGSITGYPGYRRQVNVSDGPTAQTKEVQVLVFYRPFTSVGLQLAENQVRLVSLVASP